MIANQKTGEDGADKQAPWPLVPEPEVKAVAEVGEV